MLLMIDNYDSFTYNLVRYFEELGVEVLVKHNDQMTCAEIATLAPQAIILSPGPGAPSEARFCVEVTQTFAGQIPLLGVCLGHQVIAEVFGAQVVRSKRIMHGKTSACYHINTGLWSELPNPLRVARYHSLVVDHVKLPHCFKVSAWTLDDDQCFDEIMGLEHANGMISSVQFHPEAILSQAGHQLLEQFLQEHEIEYSTNTSTYREVLNLNTADCL